MTTAKPQAQTELTDEQKRIIELEAQVAALQGQIHQVMQDQEGWLVITPNPVYDGTVYGIRFINGSAFIAKAQEVPYFQSRPENKQSIKKRYEHLIKGGEMTAQEFNEVVAEQRAREKDPTSLKAAMAMANDFGYKVEYYDATRLMELQRTLQNRAAERRQAEALQRARDQAEAMNIPGLM